MEPDRSDTNLLFGILAVKMNFIAKEDLFEAMGIWFLDRQKTLGEILVERTFRQGIVLPPDILERTGYRLPTEGEWEYVCRSGATTTWPHGLSEARVKDYAWALPNAGRVMHTPGLKPPNDLGMFDILGNAGEWCINLIDLNRDPNEARLKDDKMLFTNPTEGFGVDSRGGSFLDPLPDIRPANRNIRRVGERLPFSGFRLARTCPK
jgi:hypothetical protein